MVDTNWAPRPGPANTNWGPWPVNADWEPGPVNKNWGPSKGPGPRKYKDPDTDNN